MKLFHVYLSYLVTQIKASGCRAGVALRRSGRNRAEWARPSSVISVCVNRTRSSRERVGGTGASLHSEGWTPGRHQGKTKSSNLAKRGGGGQRVGGCYLVSHIVVICQVIDQSFSRVLSLCSCLINLPFLRYRMWLSEGQSLERVKVHPKRGDYVPHICRKYDL